MRRATLVFIFIAVLLDMLALGVMIPVLPKLIEQFSSGDTARAAEIFGLFGAVWALMQFLVSPLIGALSDRFGRRPVILISSFGQGLDYILMALAPNLLWLFIGRVISGITASNIAAAYAYVADVTPAEQRAKSFGLIGAAFGAGFVLGPAVGGLLGGIDPRLPFWASAGLSLANACYGLFILPESLPREQRAKFEWRRANPIGSLALLRSHRELLGLAISNFLAYLAHVVLPSVFVLYAGYRYGWDERAVGLTLALVGVCAIVVQSLLVGPAVARFGERTALILALICGAIGMTIFGLAPTGIAFLIGVPIMSLWGLSGPALQGLMTRRVGANEQGQLQGANSSIMGIANLVGPLIFATIFAYSIGGGRGWNLPGAAFLLAALLLVGSAVVAWQVTRPQPARP
jgi:DHA1 family tetracycline resistance protein-like MFS transporter